MHNDLYIKTLLPAALGISIHTENPGKYLLLDLEHSCAYKSDSRGELHLITSVELQVVLDALLKYLQRTD